MTEKWKATPTKFVIVNESPNILPQISPLYSINIFCMYASSTLTMGWGPKMLQLEYPVKHEFTLPLQQW